MRFVLTCGAKDYGLIGGVLLSALLSASLSNAWRAEQPSDCSGRWNNAGSTGRTPNILVQTRVYRIAFIVRTL